MILPVHTLADGQGLLPASHRLDPVAPQFVQLGEPGQRLSLSRARLSPGPTLQFQRALSGGHRLVELAGLAQLLGLPNQPVPLRDWLLLRRRRSARSLSPHRSETHQQCHSQPERGHR